jgi:hypothetical protein
MTRDEVVKGLEQMLLEPSLLLRDRDALRAAIALLQPPPTAEIEAARHDIHNCSFAEHLDMIYTALAALAREPGTEACLHRKNVRIAVLEAQIAEWNEARAEKDAEIEHLTGEVAHLLERQERQGKALKESEEWLRAAVADDKDTWAFLSCWLHLVDAFTGDPDHCEHCGGELVRTPTTPEYPDCNTWTCAKCGHVRPEMGSFRTGEAEQK